MQSLVIIFCVNKLFFFFINSYFEGIYTFGTRCHSYQTVSPQLVFSVNNVRGWPSVAQRWCASGLPTLWL